MHSICSFGEMISGLQGGNGIPVSNCPHDNAPTYLAPEPVLHRAADPPALDIAINTLNDANVVTTALSAVSFSYGDRHRFANNDN